MYLSSLATKPVHKIFLVVGAISFLCLALTTPVYAAKKKLPKVDGLAELNPAGDEEVDEILGRIIKNILGVVGSLALIMMTYGGISWMMSTGNPERLKKAQGVIFWAVIGLATIFSSYAMVDFILKNVT